MARLQRWIAACAWLVLFLATGAADAAINFSVTFDDPGNALNATVRPLLQSHAIAGGQRWATFLPGNANIEVVIRTNSAILYAEGGSVTNSFVRNNGTFDVFEQGMTAELRTGVDPNGAAPDVQIDINPAYVYDELWFDPDPVARTAVVDINRTDAMSTFLHEFGHALGFNGWINGTTGAYPGDYQSTYDERINFDGDNFYFNGPEATALYGGPVPLTFGGPVHLANFDPRPGVDLLFDVMNGLTFYRGSRYDVSTIDLAILRDAGVPAIYLPGDYDADHDVDGADLLAWQQNLGATVTQGAGADGSRNGAIDAADLAVWRTNFGDKFGVPPAAATLSAIPEPATAAIVAVASLALFQNRRRR